jgi:AraC-like DNA-binding protein
MIQSGSHSPGVDAAQFRLRPYTAMRLERPDPALRGLIGDYSVFDSEGPEAMGAVEWLLPNWPSIRFVLAQNPITAEAPGLCWSPLLEAGFYGTTSRVMRHTSYGGVTIGVSLTPAGIARLLNVDVSQYSDRMVPLADLLPHGCTSLITELRSSDQGRAVKPILDRFFLDHMGQPHRSEAEIVAVHQLLLDDKIQSASQLASEAGLSLETLRRLSLKRFGFPPKLLLMRTRFLRSLVALKQAAAMQGYKEIDLGYTDTSHFLRDCERFLGMTARRFLNLETPFLDSLLRARKLVLGTAVPALGPAFDHHSAAEAIANTATGNEAKSGSD